MHPASGRGAVQPLPGPDRPTLGLQQGPWVEDRDEVKEEVKKHEFKKERRVGGAVLQEPKMMITTTNNNDSTVRRKRCPATWG